MTPVLGMRYEHLEQLKLALANYEVANGCQLWFAKNDWRSLLLYYGRSVEGDSLRPAKSVKTDASTSEFAKYAKTDAKHKCGRNYKLDSLVTYKWIAYQFAKEIINDPFIPYINIKAQIKEKFLIDVSIGNHCQNQTQNPPASLMWRSAVQEKEYQERLDEEAFKQAMYERMDLEMGRQEKQSEAIMDPLNEYRFPKEDELIYVDTFNKTKSSINFSLSTQEYVTHAEAAYVEPTNLESTTIQPEDL
ncbi:hypothetical protein Tco_0787805 [Tanacetum coccineum]